MADRRKPAARRRGKWSVWLRRQLACRPLPLWVVITADVLVFAVALNGYALFHHVLPRRETSAGIVSQRQAAAAAEPVAPEATAEPALAQEVAPAQADPVGVFAQRFADRFTATEPVLDTTGYRSASLNISFEMRNEPELVYYIADIYIRDIECFRTVLARDRYGRGNYEWVADMCNRLGGALAVNGDFYGGRSDGVVIRNGELYRKKAPTRDVCVVFWDGSMRIISPAEWNAEAVMAEGAYQGWNFGPNLLTETGGVRSDFDSEVAGRNPRTAIGYYEPGHYCLVVVDGRSSKSKGATLERLSVIMNGLNCKLAYNLDGGQSSCMVAGGTVVSKPYHGGRKCSDAIVFVDK